MKEKLLFKHPIEKTRHWFGDYPWGKGKRHDSQSLAMKMPFYLAFGKFAAGPVPNEWTEHMPLECNDPSNKEEDV